MHPVLKGQQPNLVAIVRVIDVNQDLVLYEKWFDLILTKECCVSLQLNCSLSSNRIIKYNEFGSFSKMLNKCTVTKPVRFKLTKFTVEIYSKIV